MHSILSTLRDRGCLQDVSHFEELEALLEREPLSIYCGFDPTADSLHVGHMLPLVIMRRLQRKGHRPIVVLGSATGMIGDPSGKSEERKLLDAAQVAHNAAAIERQISLFLSDEGDAAFTLVRNDSWLGKIGYIEFLREVGKLFSVNSMVAKESVKARLENREQGISYTEFSYMLLQAYDFYHLYEQHGCRLQVGGSDQWGNITAGLELIRKKTAEGAPQAYGATFPLLTTATGAKLGKTERGAVWLAPERTSPYHFYQYWLNTADADVIRYLKLFTDLENEELAALSRAVDEAPAERRAQRRLAEVLTTLVHGETETTAAINASQVLFGASLAQVSAATLEQIFSEVPSVNLPREEAAAGAALVDLLVRCGAASSKGAARRLVEGGGVYVNNERIESSQEQIAASRFIDDSILLIRSGKKNYYLVRLT